MARDRFDHRVDHSDDTKPARLQRVEVISGVEVSDVARRHGISPQQLFVWRAKLCSAMSASAPTPVDAPTFTPVLVDGTSSRRLAASEPSRQPENAPAIEITLGSAVVRVRGAVDIRMLADVLKVLKVLA